MLLCGSKGVLDNCYGVLVGCLKVNIRLLLWCSGELQTCCHVVANIHVFDVIYVRETHIPAVFQSQPSSICWSDLLPCLHPEWSCLEKIQEQSFVRNKHWQQTENMWISWWLTCLFLHHFLMRRSVHEDHFGNFAQKHVFDHTNSIRSIFLSMSPWLIRSLFMRNDLF